MNKNEKYSIKKYNTIAATYDQTSEGKFTAKFKPEVLKLCTVAEGDKVLDVGCGNGRLIYEISRRAKIQAYGIDISPNMIATCQQRYPNITFEISSGEKLNFANHSFDMLIICCVLHHLNNADNFVKEARRVLKQDGILIIGEPWYPWGLRQLIDWIVSPIVEAGDNKIFNHTKLKRLVTGNGFEIVEFYKKDVKQIIKAKSKTNSANTQ
ncbi:MAG: methyltransferase domain-containing protein [Nitrososphaerota archaeon]|jgi:ubiquinone/menaquinone biosynthesis C-methylase UbiE|nr:methyltransferase domain-containing protein [Nitrososphaerota archaeon]